MTIQNTEPSIEFHYIYVNSEKTANDAPPASYYRRFTERFHRTYLEFKPEIKHKLIIVSAGAPPDDYILKLFDGVANEFKTYMGTGWDMGSHQYFAKQSKADLFFGSCTPVYFWRKGWMERIVEAYKEFGEGVYGPMASYENSPHLRSAFLAFTPNIMQRYPNRIDNRDKTLAFESGPPEWNFSHWILSQGLAVKLVTWDGVYDMQDFRKPPNIFRRGDQSNCMVWDRHNDVFLCADYKTQIYLSAQSDGLNNLPKPA